MNRRELILSSLGMIATPSTKLIFDMGKNAGKYPSIDQEMQTWAAHVGPYIWLRVTEDTPAYSLCLVTGGGATPMSGIPVGFGKMAISQGNLKKGEAGYFFVGDPFDPFCTSPVRVAAC